MDKFSGKRHKGGIVIPRKGSSLVSRDTIDNRDQNAQFCNRIGCNGRLKYAKSNQSESAEKPKNSRHLFCSSNGKKIVGSSSRTFLPNTNGRKSPRGSPSQSSSHLETDSSESCGVPDESDVAELVSSISRNQRGLQTGIRGSNADKVMPAVGSSSLGSSNKCHRLHLNKPRSGFKNTLPGASVPSVTPSSNSIASGARNYNGSRYGLRNLKCNSISNVIPQGSSLSESNVRRDVLRKRSPEGESNSSSKGKRGIVAPSEDGHVSGSRHSRNLASNNDCRAASVRNRRSMNLNTGIRVSNYDNINALSINESNSSIPQLSRAETPNNANLYSLSYQSSMEGSSNALSSCSLSGSTGDNVTGMMAFTSTEHGVTHVLRRQNLNGVAEVLLALERIEQDEELSYEELLTLENNLFLGHLNFYDQHRDMRLDIDNMSYEELLALEERMGTVSTALPEEAFAKCIRKRIYRTTNLDVEATGCSEDEVDIKCSICQEDYVAGDELGKLECEHGYHVVCIKQWLRLKNWCPICKASAAPSQSLSSS